MRFVSNFSLVVDNSLIPSIYHEAISPTPRELYDLDFPHHPDFSREKKLELQPVNINDVIQRAIRVVSQELSKHQVDVSERHSGARFYI